MRSKRADNSLKLFFKPFPCWEITTTPTRSPTEFVGLRPHGMKRVLLFLISVSLHEGTRQENDVLSGEKALWKVTSEINGRGRVQNILFGIQPSSSQKGGTTSSHVYTDLLRKVNTSPPYLSARSESVRDPESDGQSLTDSVHDLKIAEANVRPFSTDQVNTLSNQSRQEGENSVSLAGIEIQECPWWSCQSRCFLTPGRSHTVSSSLLNSTNQVPPRCACDNTCLTLGDCCVDFFSYCLNITEKVEVIALLKHARYSSENLTTKDDIGAWKTTYLLAVYGTCVTTPEAENVTMITKCPDESPQTDWAGVCRRTDPHPGLQPYSHKEDLALTFMNIHCARCHGYNDPELVAWREGVSCSNLSNSETERNVTAPLALNPDLVLNNRTAAESGMCTYVYAPPVSSGSTSLRPCFPDVVEAVIGNGSDVNKTGRCTFDDLLLCKSYAYQTFAADDTEVKNPHCLKCMTGVTPVSVELPCARGNKDQTLPEAVPHPPGGILALFQYHKRQDDKTVVVNGKKILLPDFTCHEDQVFDYVFRVCRTLFCPVGYLPVQGACAPSDTFFVPASTQILAKGTEQLHFQMRLPPAASCDEVTSFLLTFLRDDLTTGARMDDEATPGANYFSAHCDGEVGQTSTSSQTRTFHAVLDKIDNLTRTLDFLDDAFQESWRQNFTPSAVIANYEQEPALQCHSGYFDVIESANVSSFGGELYVQAAQEKTTALYRLTNTVFRISLYPSKPTAQTRAYLAVVCVQPLLNSTLNCSAVPYALNRTRFVNQSLHIVDTDLIFGPEAYELREHFALVCSPFGNLNERSNESRSFFEFTPVQVFVSLGCSLCSVVCLVAALVAYVVLPELRTLAGHMNASLAASLAGGQVLLLVDSIDFVRDLGACSVVAAVCHCCWLAAFTWMSAVAVHMARTFRHTCALAIASNVFARARHARALFRKYSVCCWGLPILVVAVCYTLDHLPNVGLQVGYGKLGCAWMEKTLVFITPAAGALLINIVCFVFTLVSIERTVRESRSAGSQHRSHRERLLAYTKMSSAMGLTWVFGFAAGFTTEPAVWWGYILLNGLQGAFFAFSFFLNRRFFRLLSLKVSLSNRSFSKHCYNHPDEPNSRRHGDNPCKTVDGGLDSGATYRQPLRGAAARSEWAVAVSARPGGTRSRWSSSADSVTPCEISAASELVTPGERSSSLSVTQETTIDDLRKSMNSGL